jgi:ADP-dependent NAD(P)H-hydrate dehydratase / NAD(P)H-hydrate epimerase
VGIPVLTPEELRAVDAEAPETTEVLVERAGGAVARAAVDMLGGTYGRRVVVLAGPGNNGADGRVAARRLAARGVAVRVVESERPPEGLPACDLVIDAAYGTGFRGSWWGPDPGATPVLAVDVPSGVDGLTGVVPENTRPLPARRTVTFAALKPGLLLGEGRDLAGEVTVADIGLDVRRATAWVVTDDEVGSWLPERPSDSHKWQHAVWLVAGSPGMAGAAALSCGGALRAGAGYVRLSTPGGNPDTAAVPTEAVITPLPGEGWAGEVLDGLGRFSAGVVGPGLGRSKEAVEQVRRMVSRARVPLVVDGDAISALGADAADHVGPDTVLTPHDGEYARMAGRPPRPDRVAEARELAGRLGCTVLLKGPTSVAAGPDGRALIATAGDARLATAGTGDVLTGVIAAFLAQGVPPLEAAAAGAHVHGLAGTLGWRRGLVAGDLVELVPGALELLARPGRAAT